MDHIFLMYPPDFVHICGPHWTIPLWPQFITEPEFSSLSLVALLYWTCLSPVLSTNLLYQTNHPRSLCSSDFLKPAPSRKNKILHECCTEQSSVAFDNKPVLAILLNILPLCRESQSFAILYRHMNWLSSLKFITVIMLAVRLRNTCDA